jgi:hypothetical protein
MPRHTSRVVGGSDGGEGGARSSARSRDAQSLTRAAVRAQTGGCRRRAAIAGAEAFATGRVRRLASGHAARTRTMIAA